MSHIDLTPPQFNPGHGTTLEQWRTGAAPGEIDWSKITVGTSTTMLRYNDGKPEYALMPLSFWVSAMDTVGLEYLNRAMVEGIARVLMFGAKKYASHQWRKSGSWASVGNSALRHLLAQDETDAESGLPHLAHFGCNLLFLIEFVAEPQSGVDDRYQGKPQEPQLRIDPREDLLFQFTEWLDGGPHTLLHDCLHTLNEIYPQ